MILLPTGSYRQESKAQDVAISRPTYCSREDVTRATDVKETARNNAQIDRAIEAAVDAVSGLLHRDFLPWTGVRYFDYPNHSYARPWRLWLDRNELISVTTLRVDGNLLAASDYLLRRSDGLTEPPYTHLEIDLSTSASFSSSTTHQRAIAITGVFGHSAKTTPGGELAEPLDASETGVDVTDSSRIGVGDLILTGSERMTVTAKTMADTGVNIDAGDSLTASASDTSITMSTTTGAPAVDEVILIDSERMLVVDVAGTTLTVKRAWDGSVLATHAGSADIYAPRTLTVLRAAQGTTAATHSTAATVYRHVVPGIIRQLAIGEAIAWLNQEGAGWARTAGSGESEREVVGRGLAQLRDQARTSYGRQARKRAV